MAKIMADGEEKSSKRPKINWMQVEQDYVTGYTDKKTGELYFPSLSDLAGRYGVEKNTIAKHSMKKLWVNKRSEYQELIKKKTTEAKAVDYASEVFQFSKDMFNVAKALKSAITAKVFTITKDSAGKVVRVKPNENLNSLELRRIAEVSIMVQTIQKNTMDDINVRKERTSLDDLVDILGEMRAEHNKEAGIEDKQNGSEPIVDDLKASDFLIEGVDDV